MRRICTPGIETILLQFQRFTLVVLPRNLNSSYLEKNGVFSHGNPGQSVLHIILLSIFNKHVSTLYVYDVYYIFLLSFRNLRQHS